MRLLIPALAVAALYAQVSPDKEAALGAQLSREVQSHSTVVNNAAVRDYVDRLGQKLAVFVPGVSYKFSVIADRPVGRTFEPLALPGGYVFVSTDLILTARDEAEFAGMLAHAMAHCTAPPVASRPIAIGSIPLVFAGGWGENQLVPLSLVKSHRAAELDADQSAVRTMAAAGFDPTALVRYIERMQSPANQLFSTLPLRADRIAALEQAIGQLPSKAYSMSEDFVHIQDAVRTPPVPTPRAPSLYRPDERH